MKLRRNATPIAFSKIFANSVVIKVFFWYTLLGIKYEYAVRGLTDIDTVFSARCEAKCLNKPTDQRIPCISSCLNGSWNKPGVCPSNRNDSAPNLVKATINFCESDIECSGMLKCCQHAHNGTCQASTQLENAAGLTSIPSGLVATIHRSQQENEKAKIQIRWTPVETENVNDVVVYIIEECHHYGKHFYPNRLSQWADWKHTSRSSIEYKHIGELGRWFRFRVSAVNENGTLGPSDPTEPLFASNLPRVPRAPENLRVSASSWGNGRLHLLLSWTTPASEAPIDRYKVTWSILKNFTLLQHYYTLPSMLTNFWLHNLEPHTEYFFQARAQATFGKKKLIGKQASIVFQTANETTVPEHSTEPEKKEMNLKYKRHVKNLKIDKVFWVHDQLLAQISWKPIKNTPTNYSISWSQDDCANTTKSRYIMRTEMTGMELYDLKPECVYKVSVKAIWLQSFYVANKSFSTEGCRRNESILHNIVTECSVT